MNGGNQPTAFKPGSQSSPDGRDSLRGTQRENRLVKSVDLAACCFKRQRRYGIGPI
ncbi:hypothetical protein D3C87_1302300 [compost metagenome]